jgi:hypothetical protein
MVAVSPFPLITTTSPSPSLYQETGISIWLPYDPRKISANRREPEKETGLAYRNLFLSGRVPPNDLNGGRWHAEMASEKLYDCLIGLTVLRRGVNRNPVLTSGDLCDGLDLGSRLDRYPDPGVHGLR